MEALPTIAGLALLAALAYSMWRWYHAGDKNPIEVDDDADSDGREQPQDGGPVPTKPK
jgi:hypothetical protein